MMIGNKVQHMQKAIVIGCSGAGKSTFARRLRDITGLPLYYLDMLWHKPDRTTVSEGEFDAVLSQLLQTDAWILDGNYQRTLELRIQACDTVFLFDLPLDVCLAGVASRRGTKREDMPWIETVPDEEFNQWIANFSKRELPQIYALLDRYQKEKDIVIFKSREDAEEYVIKHSN